MKPEKWLGAFGLIFLLAAINPPGSLQPGSGRYAPFINVKGAPYFAVGDGVADDTGAIQAAITAAAPGTIRFPSGTYSIGPITLPSGVHLVGNGMHETTLKAKANVNSPLITQASATITNGVEIRDLTIDGNDANNTVANSMGCIVWNPSLPASADGPGITVRNVLVTHCQSDPNGAAAVFLWPTNGAWPYFDNVRIFQNRKARGLMVKSSDGFFHAVYTASNGGDVGLQGFVINGGAANRCVECYFGGGDGAEAVLIWGGQYNEFVSCINDSAWQHGYRFIDQGATPASFNTINGGFITNPSQNTTNTYDHISFEGAAANNVVNGVQFNNSLANKGRWAVTELGTSNNNMLGLNQYGTFGTGINNLRAAGGSQITVSVGQPTLGTTLQANLGTPVNGTIIYCSDCTKATPCAGAGTGALAKRLNGAWDCN